MGAGQRVAGLIVIEERLVLARGGARDEHCECDDREQTSAQRRSPRPDFFDVSLAPHPE
jgi:hypothetical protein